MLSFSRGEGLLKLVNMSQTPSLYDNYYEKDPMILHPGKIPKKIKKKVSPFKTVGEESRVFLQGLQEGVPLVIR